jgi:integrase
MAKRLTDLGLRNLKPRATRYEVPAGHNLFVVCQPSGKRRFCVRYRVRGVSRKLTLPAGITLATARAAAADAMRQVEQGWDPATAKRDAAERAALAEHDTLAAVIAEFYKRDGSRLRSAAEQQATLRRHVLPLLGKRPIHGVTRREINRVLDGVEDASGTRAADLAMAYWRRVCRWFAARDETYSSPFTPGMTRWRPSERMRTRLLSDQEIKRVWETSAEMAGPFPALIKFLLLSCARRAEAAKLTWDEIQDGVWYLPPERNKVKRELARPLSAAAQAVLAELPRFDGCPYAFTSDGRAPLSGYSKYKAKFDARCGVKDFVLHDTRRVGRSLLARCGVADRVAEMMLGHVPTLIVQTYNRHGYLAEMRDAAERLSQLIERITNPPQDNVIDMAARR